MKKFVKRNKAKELNDYLDKYEPDIDVPTLRYMVYSQVSDTIFDMHQEGCHYLNFMLIFIQLSLVVFGLVMEACFKVEVSQFTCVASLTIMMVIILNNFNHTQSWRKARKRHHVIERLNKSLSEHSMLFAFDRVLNICNLNEKDKEYVQSQIDKIKQLLEEDKKKAKEDI